MDKLCVLGVLAPLVIVSACNENRTTTSPENNPNASQASSAERKDHAPVQFHGSIDKDVVDSKDANEPISLNIASTAQVSFEDWPEPDVVLFVTGRQHGYIEPCGCTGLDTQKGGLSRRHSLLKRLKELGWSVVPLDVGNQVRRFGVQPNIKFHTTVAGLRQMGYRAIGFGPHDLRLSADEVYVAMLGDDESTTPFVSANVNLYDEGPPTYQVIKAGDKRIGVTAVLGDRHHDHLGSDVMILTKAAVALEEVWPKLSDESCDVHILLAHASIEDSKELARRVPNFDVVITAGGAGEPTYQPEPIEDTDAVLVQVGTKGMYVGVIGVYSDADPPLRYQRIVLEAKWKDSPDMLRLLANYQLQLETLGLKDLDIRPANHPSGRTFVGTETCGECHTNAYAKWLETPHSHATETLVHPPKRYEVPRHHDPECLSCHVTGWNPQGFFPYTTGYMDLDESAHLHGNGCENCHGPGSEHVAAEQGDVDVDDEQLNRLRESMRLLYADARETCLECHDLDNSPDFHDEGAFEKKYWPKIIHEGKD